MQIEYARIDGKKTKIMRMPENELWNALFWAFYFGVVCGLFATLLLAALPIEKILMSWGI